MNNRKYKISKWLLLILAIITLIITIIFIIKFYVYWSCIPKEETGNGIPLVYCKGAENLRNAAISGIIDFMLWVGFICLKIKNK